ncbi:DUF4386 domain-containing protein [Tahibacter amnicola]|uniref:DUF4386 domain-containing protein n=1 Tax=Tahibacter amnicola TaxID=2976241 RepID=A0ABY6BFY2_9GAMM|nr:DUF4386 domain-containing protein [Tahibacter amnicola]UXI68933.1 DUF4386 domain-containing protein [Tahibacter amnicola]
MDTIKRNARTAALLYLLLVLVAPIRLVYVPSQLFVSGDMATTAANIMAHPGLFRLGILTDLFCATLEVFLTLALFRLFKDVDRRSAVLMAVLGLMPVPLYFVNVFNDVAVAHLLLGASPAGFTAEQVMSLVRLAMTLHDAGINMLQIFWGAWLFPLAALAAKSRLVPRFAAGWLFVNGVAYLALSVTGLVAPSWNGTVSLAAVPAQLGEVVFVVCLLWCGIRGHRATSAPAAGAVA